MGAPISFLMHMREINLQLDEPDVDDVPNPLHKFLEKRQIAFAGGSAGVAAFQKIGKAPFKPPTDDTNGNPWLIKHETVHSQQIENTLDEEINADPRELTKRIGDSTRRANMTAFIKRQLAIGETVESLADYARKHDEETANLILEIGSEL